jgi:hypothetical protein
MQQLSKQIITYGKLVTHHICAVHQIRERVIYIYIYIFIEFIIRIAYLRLRTGML